MFLISQNFNEFCREKKGFQPTDQVRHKQTCSTIGLRLAMSDIESKSYYGISAANDKTDDPFYLNIIMQKAGFLINGLICENHTQQLIKG